MIRKHSKLKHVQPRHKSISGTNTASKGQVRGCFFRLVAFLNESIQVFHHFLHGSQLLLTSPTKIMASLTPSYISTLYYIKENKTSFFVYDLIVGPHFFFCARSTFPFSRGFVPLWLATVSRLLFLFAIKLYNSSIIHILKLL